MEFEIGSRIKAARKKAGLTQTELGEMIGVSGVAIMRYEKEQRQASLKTLGMIAAALGVDIGDLLGGPQAFSDPDEFQAVLRTLTSNPDPDAESVKIAHGVTPMTPEQLQRINAASNHMSAEGIAEAVERFCEVSEIPKYQQA